MVDKIKCGFPALIMQSPVTLDLCYGVKTAQSRGGGGTPLYGL